MHKFKFLALVVLGAATPMICFSAGQLTVQAVNKLPLARAHQTMEISAQALSSLGEKDLEKIHILDASGKDVLCQAVDTDYDAYHKPDVVIFQADFSPQETRTFTVTTGKKHEYAREDFKAYGRFARERFDDFAWENDRIAHRTYGKALETWKGEPLTSSAIDVWTKRVSQLVINDWYLLDNYHSDMGQGCDDYSAGSTRGCGGSGLWAGDKLWVPSNFVDSRMLANGPIRVLFELVYEPFEMNGKKASEVMRISLDAGSQLDHFQVSYALADGGALPAAAVGLKKVTGEQKDFDVSLGAWSFWEPMEKKMGMLGVAAIIDPKAFKQEAQDAQNNLLILNAGPDNSISYWAGFAWDRAGQISTQEAWKKYISEFAQGLQSPIGVTVSAK